MSPRRRFPAGPGALLSSAWNNRGLIRQLTRREIVGRYRGSILGILWPFLNPMILLAVYTFVFSVVFKVRWGGTGPEDKTAFAVVLFTGMIVYGLFSECLSRAPGLVVGNPNYVKKVVFPLEILPWVSLCASLFHMSVGVGVLLCFQVATRFGPHPTAFLLPLVIAPLALLTMGLSWFIASMGVYVRDVGQTVALVLTVLMFASPVFYPIASVPERYRPLVLLNPLTFPIEQTRNVVVWGKAPDLAGLALYTAASALVALLGFAWFQRTRTGFADVL